MIVITSRDPAPPGLDYLNAAGGFFRDTTIHDFDLSRFILGDDPIVQVSAFGENLFDENTKTAKDFDTAMFILKSKSGVLVHINNSRRAVYGYDQRVEVFGSKGMVISNNQTPNSIERFTSTSTSSKEPIHFFFIERYHQAYRDQLNSFIEMINSNLKPKVTFEDGRKALIIANAAYESFENKKIIKENLSTQFKDKIIVVTGSTQGSGAETAKLLARRGAKGITICGRNEKKGKKVKSEIEALGTDCIYIKADLENLKDCKKISLKLIKNLEQLIHL